MYTSMSSLYLYLLLLSAFTIGNCFIPNGYRLLQHGKLYTKSGIIQNNAKKVATETDRAINKSNKQNIYVSNM